MLHQPHTRIMHTVTTFCPRAVLRAQHASPRVVAATTEGPRNAAARAARTDCAAARCVRFGSAQLTMRVATPRTVRAQ
jgi:hypothetical protein